MLSVYFRLIMAITRASYGMTVKVVDQQDQREQVFQLVRVEEENWAENKISMYHPLGKALFSKVAGDVLDVIFDDGKVRRIKVLEIEPT